MLWGGVSHPLQLTTGLVVNSFIITNPTLAGEPMLLIPKVSILSGQIYVKAYTHNQAYLPVHLSVDSARH